MVNRQSFEGSRGVKVDEEDILISVSLTRQMRRSGDPQWVKFRKAVEVLGYQPDRVLLLGWEPSNPGLCTAAHLAHDEGITEIEFSWGMLWSMDDGVVDYTEEIGDEDMNKLAEALRSGLWPCDCCLSETVPWDWSSGFGGCANCGWKHEVECAPEVASGFWLAAENWESCETRYAEELTSYRLAWKVRKGGGNRMAGASPPPRAREGITMEYGTCRPDVAALMDEASVEDVRRRTIEFRQSSDKYMTRLRARLASACGIDCGSAILLWLEVDEQGEVGWLVSEDLRFIDFVWIDWRSDWEDDTGALRVRSGESFADDPRAVSSYHRLRERVGV